MKFDNEKGGLDGYTKGLMGVCLNGPIKKCFIRRGNEDFCDLNDVKTQENRITFPLEEKARKGEKDFKRIACAYCQQLREKVIDKTPDPISQTE